MGLASPVPEDQGAVMMRRKRAAKAITERGGSAGPRWPAILVPHLVLVLAPVQVADQVPNQLLTSANAAVREMGPSWARSQRGNDAGDRDLGKRRRTGRA